MKTDSEIVLTGSAAHDFHNRMRRVDMTAIEARDSFLADVNCWVDNDGILSVDVSDLEIDLSVLKENNEVIEARLVPKEEKYSNCMYSIDVQYSSTKAEVSYNNRDTNNLSYCIDNECYVQSVLDFDNNMAFSYAS